MSLKARYMPGFPPVPSLLIDLNMRLRRHQECNLVSVARFGQERSA